MPGYAQDTRSVWTALAWQDAGALVRHAGHRVSAASARSIGGLRLQANVAHSTGRPSDPLSLAPRDSASGAWLDANWRTEWLRQSASVFYFEPSLRWGADNLPSDLRGVSWHGDITTRQWQLGLANRS